MDNDKYNLMTLLKECKIQIPLLQRDFAQGRNKQSHVRESFLNSICKFLENNDTTKEKNLDFIYGYEERGYFLPIDGQQRITTLWLIHIYLSSKLDDKSEYKNLKNFTYATRENAKEFCLSISRANGIKFTSLPSKQLKENSLINSYIGEDPTVLAMLNMLDAIHKKFANADPQKFLTRLENIKFHVINMKDFSLGEELYIKMNARGKLLSSFENFKSWVQQDKDTEQDMDLLASIDNDWIDFFWKQNKETWEQDIIKTINYIAIFLILQEKTKEESKKFIEYNLKEEFFVFNEKYFIFNNKKIFSHRNLKKVDKIMHFLIKMKEHKYSLPYKTDDNYEDSFSYHNIVPKFFAIFFYALDESGHNTIENFKDWQDITNHIIENTRDIDDNKRMSSIFPLLKDLSIYCTHILAFLSEGDKSNIESNLGKDRIDEEILKARLIIQDGRNGEWEKAINKVQHNTYFNGWIDFILEYSKNEEDFLKSFKRYSIIFRSLFDEKFLKENLHLIQRALFSIKEYALPNKNKTIYFLGSTSKELPDGKEQWSKIFKEGSFKVLAHQLLRDSNLIEAIKSYGLLEDNTRKAFKKALENIIKENLKNKEWTLDDWWRWLLVSSEIALSYCKDNRFSCGETNSLSIIYLIKGKKFSKIGVNLLGYGLHEYLQKAQNPDTFFNNIEFSNFNDNNYENSLRFTLNKKIEIHIEQGSNVIEIKKVGVSPKIFEITKENKENYKNIHSFYQEIYQYITEIL